MPTGKYAAIYKVASTDHISLQIDTYFMYVSSIQYIVNTIPIFSVNARKKTSLQEAVVL